MDWFLNHVSTFVISVILFAVIGLIIRSMSKKKKVGESSCGCGCSSCAMNGSCHGEKQ